MLYNKLDKIVFQDENYYILGIDNTIKKTFYEYILVQKEQFYESKQEKITSFHLNILLFLNIQIFK